MPKSGVLDTAPRKQRLLRPAELPNAVEGQIEELCHEVAVQVKRMRRLHEQANELRTAIRRWAGRSDVGVDVGIT